MTQGNHFVAADLRGLARLATDATAGVTALVEALHQTIASGAGVLGPTRSGRTTGVTGLVYRSIHAVTALVGGTLDAALAALPVAGDPSSSPARDAVLAALNGVLGDHLAATGNPLAISMRLCHGATALELERPALAAAIPRPTPKLLLLVHGLCLSDRCWDRTSAASDSGPSTPTTDRLPALLARELGYTPLTLRYNSGLHVSTNGGELAALLERLVQSWPVPPAELAIVAHSMGGLVTRSACHQAAVAGHDWQRLLRQIVFLATPHHGAPLERGGNWLDRLLVSNPYSAPFARLGGLRSAGITDLRHGNLLDADWLDRDRFAPSPDRPHPVPLPRGVRCHAIAATTARPGTRRTRLPGDGLVPTASALGHHPDPTMRLRVPASRQRLVHGVGHLELLGHPEVHAQVLRWLATTRLPRPPAHRPTSIEQAVSP